MYDSARHLYYIFFRHGQSMIVNPMYPKIAKQQTLCHNCVQQVLYCKNQVLLVVMNDQIDFYRLHIEKDETMLNGPVDRKKSNTKLDVKRQETDIAVKERTRHFNWQMYHTLSIKGFVSMVEKSDEFQVVTDTLIYFYQLVEKDDELMPICKNCMFNFI